MGIGVNLDVLTNEISGQLSEQGKKDLLEGFRNPKNRIHLAFCTAYHILNIRFST